jgi:predicted MFS family arabinose efflux permease
MYSNLAALLSGAGVALGITIGLARHWKRAFVIFTSTACIAVIGILFRIKARKEKKE